MSQPQKPPFWYRFLHPIRDTATSISPFENSSSIPEIKIITENDLKIESILLEEFRFRGEFLKQIASDITNTYNLYFIFIGIAISGIGVIYQLAGGIHNNLQSLEVLSFLLLGMASSLFFIRFVALIRNRWRERACMDTIRAYYIKHLQSQIPDISHVFRISMDSTSHYNYGRGLVSIFTMIDSLCFAAATFVFTELWLSIRSGSLLFLPSDFRPYIFGLLVGGIVLFFHILYFRLALYKFVQILQEKALSV